MTKEKWQSRTPSPLTKKLAEALRDVRVIVERQTILHLGVGDVPRYPRTLEQIDSLLSEAQKQGVIE